MKYFATTILLASCAAAALVSRSCKDFTLNENHVLTASCRDRNQVYQAPTSVDLDDCYSNLDGQIQAQPWVNSQSFSTCSGCHIYMQEWFPYGDFLYISCACPRDDGSIVTSEARMGTFSDRFPCHDRSDRT